MNAFHCEAIFRGCTFLLAVPAASAQPTQRTVWESKSEALGIEGGLDTCTAYCSMRGTWWHLAADSAPAFDTDRSFAELWVQPKLNSRCKLENESEVYASLSVGATQTIGADAFDYENEDELRFGSAALGVRGNADGWTCDVSFGRQPFTLGTGMLLTAGSSNGYTWGDGASTQRKTWGRSLVARANSGEFTGTAFALEPDEVPDARADTRVQGVAIEWARPQMGKVCLSWFTAPCSQAIYPGDVASRVFIEHGREGLDTWHGWADVTGLVPAVPTLGFRAEFAQQRNDITRADGRRDATKASAWLLGASWWGQSLPFAPKFIHHVARFSGDKPGTTTHERFDPMFWGNGLDNGWFGANVAYSWLNAKLPAQRFIVDASLSAQDILQFQFVRGKADQLDSAVQFGQGVRFTGNGLVVGVPQADLFDDFYLQYARVFNPVRLPSWSAATPVPG